MYSFNVSVNIGMLHELAVYHISWYTFWVKVYTKYMGVQPSNLIAVLFQHTVRIYVCIVYGFYQMGF